MKKIAVLCGGLLLAANAFADYGYYGYSSHDDEMSGFAIFTLIVMIVYIVISIIVLVRWWKMTSNVDQIREQLTHPDHSLTYLVAIGEKEEAQRRAVKMLVDKLYDIYMSSYMQSKADVMDKEIMKLLPSFKRLGLAMPEYVSKGEIFIDYMNGLTGGSVSYK